MAEQLANNAQSTLNGTITNAVVSLVVTNGTVFPSAGNFRIVIDSEIIIVGARAGNTLSSLTRGAEGTTAAGHTTGALVTHVLTTGALDAYLKDITHIATGTPDGTKFLRDDDSLQNVPNLIGIRVLTGAGTYTPTTGTKKVLVCAIGGGGAGGGTPTAPTQVSVGGGGGGAAYVEKFLTTGFSGASYSVGAGGTGAAGANGGAGADTSFGTGPLVLAKGGAGGPVGVANVTVLPGAGGLASTSIGDFKMDGGAGEFGGAGGGTPISTGGGGQAPRGGAGGRRMSLPSASVVAGAAGVPYGGGGSGAAVSSNAATGTGGNGGAGTIVIYEYA